MAREGEAQSGVITPADPLIVNGIKKFYSRAADAYWPMELPSNPVPATPAITNLASEIVFSADGQYAFIKDPLSCYATNSYMFGVVEGNKITVSLPQLIQIDKGDDYEKDYYLYRYGLMEDEEGEYYGPDENVETLTYTIGADGVVSMDEGQAIGLVYDNVLDFNDPYMHACGYIDAQQVFTPVNDAGVVLPAGLVTEQWGLMHGDKYGFYIQMGIDGNDVYVKGIAGFNAPEAWIKGSMADGKISFPSGQFLGKSAVTNQFAYFQAVDAPFVKNEYFEYYDLTHATVKDAIVFDYDANAKTMNVVRPEDGSTGVAIMVSYSETGLDGDKFFTNRRKFMNPHAEYRGSVTEPIIPADPTGVGLDDSQFASSGYYTLWFTLPQQTASGDFLDLSRTFYNVVIDDELFTVYPDEYKKVSEQITNIPYWFADSGNYDIMTSGDEGVQFTIYARGYDDAGVQCVYRNDDGNYSYSHLVYAKAGAQNHIDVPVETAVKEVTSGNAVSETFYDLSGRRVAGAQRGVLIRVTSYDNGSTTVSKVLCR